MSTERFMTNAFIGGSLIGLAASLMLLFNGKVTGISGILGEILNPKTSDKKWRLLFIAGLMLGGYILKMYTQNEVFKIETRVLTIDYVIAGFLVGFGTLLGNGCTSGHGVCGISRLSPRSIIATIVFISSGILSVLVFKLIRGEL